MERFRIPGGFGDIGKLGGSWGRDLESHPQKGMFSEGLDEEKLTSALSRMRRKTEGQVRYKGLPSASISSPPMTTPLLWPHPIPNTAHRSHQSTCSAGVYSVSCTQEASQTPSKHSRRPHLCLAWAKLWGHSMGHSSSLPSRNSQARRGDRHIKAAQYD